MVTAAGISGMTSSPSTGPASKTAPGHARVDQHDQHGEHQPQQLPALDIAAAPVPDHERGQDEGEERRPRDVADRPHRPEPVIARKGQVRGHGAAAEPLTAGARGHELEQQGFRGNGPDRASASAGRAGDRRETAAGPWAGTARSPTARRARIVRSPAGAPRRSSPPWHRTLRAESPRLTSRTRCRQPGTASRPGCAAGARLATCRRPSSVRPMAPLVTVKLPTAAPNEIPPASAQATAVASPAAASPDRPTASPAATVR